MDFTMTDKISTLQRSKLMSKIRGKNTNPELKLRKALWAVGLRYRLHYRIGKYRPDIVFVGKGVVVFVDGCFWHSCPIHKSTPKDNNHFWNDKFIKNLERDSNTNDFLKADGWEVIRFWEHEINEKINDCVTKVVRALASIK